MHETSSGRYLQKRVAATVSIQPFLQYSEQGKCSGDANALVELMDMPFARAQLKDQL